MAKVWQVEGLVETPVATGWEMCGLAPGTAETPTAIPADAAWRPAEVPGTIASALRKARAFRYGETNFDADDYWLRCRLSLPPGPDLALRFDGLATLAELFWNGERLLQTRNMFRSYRVALSGQRDGDLYIRFRSLHAALAERRPRPRWRTALVGQQQLRWLRTTLLGRIPAWLPTIQPVGCYRPVVIEQGGSLRVKASHITTRVDQDCGVVEVSLKIQRGTSQPIQSVHVAVGEITAVLNCHDDPGTTVAQGTIRVPHVKLWWPHTHGEQALYPVAATVTDAGGQTTAINLGTLGFRTLTAQTDDGGFAIAVNGVPVFCRGACWTPQDLVSLSGDHELLRPTLEAAKAAGMNMLRVGATMIYESDAFYQLCDELGIMVWQDFMFSNMDYPVDEPGFAAEIAAEAREFLERVQTSPAVVVVCGNSEIEQQAAMLGIDRELWTNHFFDRDLPKLCRDLRPDTVYWPSSPSGGVLPFHVAAGVSHYYGVGAYRRPLNDARQSGVRFATECLGFANVPSDKAIEEFLAPGESPFHHPKWKERVPRVTGDTFDFDEVRDHYTAALFGVEPSRLRAEQPQRFLELSRITSGEIMARVLGEWRRSASPNRGALIWFLKDLWPGVGWGLIEAAGRPKAAYFQVKRAMQPLAVFLSDEGLNGLEIEAVNDGPQGFRGEVELSLYRHGEVCVASERVAVSIPPHSGICLKADAILGRFLDTTYSYRFGPPGHDLSVVTLRANDGGAVVSQDFHFPIGRHIEHRIDTGLNASCSPVGGGVWELELSAPRLAQSVAIEVAGYRLEDNYFHLAPGIERTLRLVPDGDSRKPSGSVFPLNAVAPVRIVIEEPGG